MKPSRLVLASAAALALSVGVSAAASAPDTLRRCQNTRGGERVVERLFRLGQDAAVVPPGRLGGLNREQDAALRIDVQVRSRRGSELASRGETCIVSGSRAQDERERCKHQRGGGQRGEPGEDRPPPSRTTSCGVVGR